jgi:hypothetical protein
MRASFFFVLLVTACDGGPPPPTPILSSTLAPSAIDVTATITSNGSAALVDATLVSNGASVRLSGDSLVASATDASALALGEYTPGHYAVLLPTISQTITLAFLRGGKSIASMDLMLPTAFAIAAPATPSRSMSIPLTWAPGVVGETLALSITAPCLSGGKATRTPDPLGGGFTLQAADFIAGGVCTLSIEITRSASMPKAIGGLGSFSSATLVQKRTLELVTQP